MSSHYHILLTEVFVTIFVFDFIVHVILDIIIGIGHVGVEVLLAFRQKLDGIG